MILFTLGGLSLGVIRGNFSIAKLMNELGEDYPIGRQVRI